MRMLSRLIMFIERIPNSLKINNIFTIPVINANIIKQNTKDKMPNVRTFCI